MRLYSAVSCAPPPQTRMTRPIPPSASQHTPPVPGIVPDADATQQRQHKGDYFKRPYFATIRSFPRLPHHRATTTLRWLLCNRRLRIQILTHPTGNTLHPEHATIFHPHNLVEGPTLRTGSPRNKPPPDHAAIPLCRNNGSTLGSRPRNATNSSIGSRLPPCDRI